MMNNKKVNISSLLGFNLLWNCIEHLTLLNRNTMIKILQRYYFVAQWIDGLIKDVFKEAHLYGKWGDKNLHSAVIYA